MTICGMICAQVSQWYELVIFTASMEVSLSLLCIAHNHMHKTPADSMALQMYGMAVANKLENNKNIFQRRYFRQVRITISLVPVHLYQCLYS